MKKVIALILFLTAGTAFAGGNPELDALLSCLEKAPSNNHAIVSEIQGYIDAHQADYTATLTRMSKRSKFRNWVSRLRAGVETGSEEAVVELDEIRTKSMPPKSAYGKALWHQLQMQELRKLQQYYQFDSEMNELRKIAPAILVAPNSTKAEKDDLEKMSFRFDELEMIFQASLLRAPTGEKQPALCLDELKEFDEMFYRMRRK